MSKICFMLASFASSGVEPPLGFLFFCFFERKIICDRRSAKALDTYCIFRMKAGLVFGCYRQIVVEKLF